MESTMIECIAKLSQIASHGRMSIEISVIAGGAAGLLIGLLAHRPKVGCTILSIIPAAMIVYIAIWQAQNPESLRSTSGLDFLFGPLWPSMGGIGGFAIGQMIRSFRKDA